MLTFLICSVILYSFAVALPTEQETLDKRATTCALPKHLYKNTCVYPCPSPGYYLRAQNECFDCGQGVKSCSSTQALGCKDPKQYISGKNCVSVCPKGSDAWPKGKRCVPCGAGKYLNLDTGECATPDQTPNSATYLRFAGHQRTAVVRQKDDPYDPLTFSSTSSLSCITSCVNAELNGGNFFYNFNLYNSYYHRCECHRFFEASPSEPPYAQRYTAGHEVDYLTIGSDTPSGCNNPDNKAQYEALLPGYTSCIHVFFAGETCYVYGTKNICSTAFT